MSARRYAARRDNNDAELRQFAERVGWQLFPLREYCDYPTSQLGFQPMKQSLLVESRR